MSNLLNIVDEVAYEVMLRDNPTGVDLLLNLLDNGVKPERLEKRLIEVFGDNYAASITICAYYHLARIRENQER